MRWPLRRRRHLAQENPAARTSRRGRRDWALLPLLPTTAAPRPPILHDAFLALPPVSGTRPLLRPGAAPRASRDDRADQASPPARHAGQLHRGPALTHPPAPDEEPGALVEPAAAVTPDRTVSPDSVPALSGVPASGVASDRPPEVTAAQQASAVGAAPPPRLLPVRTAPVVSRPPGTRLQLTRATDDYVG